MQYIERVKKKEGGKRKGKKKHLEWRKVLKERKKKNEDEGVKRKKGKGKGGGKKKEEGSPWEDCWPNQG